MGRAPCCDKANVKKGPWSPEEDAKLKEYIEKHGTGGNWIALPQKAGLKRCGKSCRLRWLNYLRPNIKHGGFSDDEDRIICNLYANIGSRWSIIAAQLPGRTDNDIKNYWNTKLKKKLMGMINPPQHQRTKPHQQHQAAANFSSLLHQASSLPSSPSTPVLSPSSSSSYKLYSSNSTYYNSLATSFTEPISFSSSGLTTYSTSHLLQPQEANFMGPLMQHFNQVRDGHNSRLMFGGDQASCSSSDGSCNNNQVNNHAKELEYDQYGGAGNYIDHRYHQQMGFQISNCHINGVEENNQQKLILANGTRGVNNGWSNTGATHDPLDQYGLEEIKQLLSSSSCNNFLFDENKTGERFMYYK